MGSRCVSRCFGGSANAHVLAFFEESFEYTVGLVQKAPFEARLHEHLQQGPSAANDVAWYALRNTVYAIGCRIHLSAEGRPEAYVTARQQSWRYFENAMSVHTELLFMRTNTMAVEALLLMVRPTARCDGPILIEQGFLR